MRELGEVVVAFRILPENPDESIEKLAALVKSKVAGKCEINKVMTEEIAFGLKAIRLEIIVPDEEGLIGTIESDIASVAGVSQVDTEDVTLV